MPDHPLSPMKKLDPEFMKHLEETEALVYADGALPRKIKLLMAMAFDAGRAALAMKTAFSGPGRPFLFT